jgi:hypothetical protein
MVTLAKSTINLPDLTWYYQQLIDTGMLIPGWPKMPELFAYWWHMFWRKDSHSQALELLPKLFNQATQTVIATCLASYEEEYYGLVAHDTSTIIDATEYKALHDLTLYCSGLPINMIPSVNMSKLECAPILTTCQ